MFFYKKRYKVIFFGENLINIINNLQGSTSMLQTIYLISGAYKQDSAMREQNISGLYDCSLKQIAYLI